MLRLVATDRDGTLLHTDGTVTERTRHAIGAVVCIAGVAISVLMFITMDSMMQGFSDKFIIETVEASGNELRQSGWKAMDGIAVPAAALAAWNELLVGMLSVHDRFMTLNLEDRRDRENAVVWRVNS